MELLSTNLNIDFVRQSRVFASISAALMLVSAVILFWPGPELGIEFSGGTLIQVQAPQEVGAVDEGPIRDAVAEAGHPGAVIQRLGALEDRRFTIAVQATAEENRQLADEIQDALSKGLGGPVVLEKVDSIGPRVGRELATAGVVALALSWVLILVYVAFRFDLRYAPGAVIALAHDVLVTAGIFVLFRLPFTPEFIAALLVIMGYSLNDTIVIYDRIRENVQLRGTTHLEDVVNLSINQTLARTLLTALTVLIVVVTLLVFGGDVLRQFSLALVIGVIVGCYSTVYVASALLIFLERRFGRRGAGGSGKDARRARLRERAAAAP